MSRSIFTPEELEELRRADAEIEAGFVMTHEERQEIKKRDRKPRKVSEATLEKNRARSKAYYWANREKVLAQQKARYEANREVLLPYYRARQRIYDAAHREEINAKRRAARAAAKSMIMQEGKGSHGAEQHESVCEV